MKYLIVIVFSMLVSGCVVAPYDPYYGYYGYPAYGAVYAAPSVYVGGYGGGYYRGGYGGYYRR